MEMVGWSGLCGVGCVEWVVWSGLGVGWVWSKLNWVWVRDWLNV